MTKSEALEKLNLVYLEGLDQNERYQSELILQDLFNFFSGQQLTEFVEFVKGEKGIEDDEDSYQKILDEEDDFHGYFDEDNIEE